MEENKKVILEEINELKNEVFRIVKEAIDRDMEE